MAAAESKLKEIYWLDLIYVIILHALVDIANSDGHEMGNN